MAYKAAKNITSNSTYKCNGLWIVSGATGCGSVMVRFDSGATADLYIPAGATQGVGFQLDLSIVGIGTLPAGVTLMGLR